MSSSHRRLSAGSDAGPDDAGRPPASPRRFERLLVVANRLPGTWDADADGIEACADALTPHLASGAWIGGRTEDEASSIHARIAPATSAVALPRDEAREHQVFCRRTLLPLFHGVAGAARFEPRWWQAYRRVNRRFADAVERLANPTTLVWVHGPQLTGVGALLRTPRPSSARPAATIGGLAHSLHGPFPPRELFLRLPWRRELLDAFLSYDFLGFESRREVEHFIDCLTLVGGAGDLDGDVGFARIPNPATPGGWRRVRLEVSPRGVDFRGLSKLAETPAVAEGIGRLRAGGGGRRLLVAVERLDPSRGLSHLLSGYAALLEEKPDLVRRVALVLAVDRGPDPVDGPLQADVERRVGEVNGRFSRAGCPAILYHHRRFDAGERVALHRAADVVLSTPLREASGRPGLAAVAARSDGDGVLIVSDLSPAVDRLAPDPGRGALAVSPYDVEALAATILRSLALPESDRRRRMRYLRTVAASADLDGWVESVCRAAGLVSHRGAVAAIARRPPHRSPRRTPAGQAARPA